MKCPRMVDLYRRVNLPFQLYEVNVLNAGDDELNRISSELRLALSLDEMRAIKRYFSNTGRNPTDIEIQTIAQTWSEHCYHKTFRGVVVTPNGTIENIFKTYIAKATEEINPEWCISVFEDNAGIIEFGDGYAIAVKVETHNHPSAIEPFGGAATGIGGVLRDILGVWADPIANIDVLCFGPLDLDYSRLPLGIHHPRYLFKGVVAGIAHYGNNMGVPTVCGALYFDEGYIGNIVVYCGSIGLLPIDRYVKNVGPSDVIVLAGGRTGRDGIHGVTFASLELTRDLGGELRSAVQIPNPVEEEKLRRAIVRIRDEGLASGITDLGGGGLSSAIGETAYKNGCGATVELDRVPLKDLDMSPWEIFLSESQERMLIATPRCNVGRVLEILREEEVEAAQIGVFTGSRILKVYYRGYLICSLDLDFLFNPPRTVRYASYPPIEYSNPVYDEPSDYREVMLRLLASPNIASREPIIRVYDHEVKGITALKPLHGDYGGPNDAVVLKPLPSSWRGIVVSVGLKPSYGVIDPYWMAASSIDEAIRNNVAVGGRRIALLDNFTWGNPEKPDRMGSLLQSVKACYDLAKLYGTPFISGKDSLYNESPLGPVTPTLLITAIGIIPDIRRAVSIEFKEPGNPVYVLGLTHYELGGSEYHRLIGVKGGLVPKVSGGARRITDAVTKAIDMGLVKACHDVSGGGLGVAIAEMCLSGSYGVEVYLGRVPRSFNTSRSDYILFSESNTRFIVEASSRHLEDFEKLIAELPHALIGRVVKGSRLVVHGVNGDVILDEDAESLRDAWKSSYRWMA